MVLVNVTVDLSGRDFVSVRPETRGGGENCQQEGEELLGVGCRLHCDSESTEMMMAMNGEEGGVDEGHTAIQANRTAGQDSSRIGHSSVVMM